MGTKLRRARNHPGTGYRAHGDRKLIVYTSADSVLQIAAHDRSSLGRTLPRVHRYQRANGENTGRTGDRQTICRGGGLRVHPISATSLEPPQDTILDKLTAAGYPGRWEDEGIFAGRGIHRAVQRTIKTVNATLTYMRELQQPGLIFANLVDFDMLWGHRNDPQAMRFGAFAPACQAATSVVTRRFVARVTDHGCDPYYRQYGPSREYVPLWLTGITHHTATWGIPAPSPMWLRRWPLFSKWITLVGRQL